MNPSETETLKMFDEIVREVHIKWLSKAKTAKIDGSEMTVLPYGYLSQAVKEVLIARADERKQAYAEGVKDGEGTKNGVQRYQMGYEDGKNAACDAIAERVEKRYEKAHKEMEVPYVALFEIGHDIKSARKA